MTAVTEDIRFALPDELTATEPPEARGLSRDEVRLLVAEGDTITHTRFRGLGRFLRAGDLVVVNTSATIPAAVDGVRADGTPVVVHFATPLDPPAGPPPTGPTVGSRPGVPGWVVELRRAPDEARPVLDATPGERLTVTGGVVLTLVEPYRRRPDGTRLWRADVALEGTGATGEGVTAYLGRAGRPITYGYLHGAWPLPYYQTVFTGPAGSAEMPSAGRPFTADLVTSLVSEGVRISPIVLHTGVSSQDAGETPQAERYSVPAATARLVNETRAGGGRIVAVGTTVTRALETVAAPDGTVRAGSDWTELVLSPDRPARVVDGLISGWHAPDASHLLLLQAVVGPAMVRRAYAAALEYGYLWHEFGDSCLLFADRLPRTASANRGERS
jgi:S-adenosylmethionine:tRNA ribosyltransferase-isomerase